VENQTFHRNVNSAIYPLSYLLLFVELSFIYIDKNMQIYHALIVSVGNAGVGGGGWGGYFPILLAGGTVPPVYTLIND
jgi:hypothetical protein